MLLVRHGLIVKVALFFAGWNAKNARYNASCKWNLARSKHEPRGRKQQCKPLANGNFNTNLRVRSVSCLDL